MRSEPKWVVTALAALMLVLLQAAGAAAQECLRPSGGRANWVAVGSGVAQGRHTAATVEAGRRLERRVSVFAEGDVLTWNDGGDLFPFRRSARLVGLYRVHGGVCATTALEYVKIGDLEIVLVPVGIPLSTELKLGGGQWRLVPHVEPRVGYRHADLLGFTEISVAASVNGGIAVATERYFAGVTLHQPFKSGDAWTARFRLGLAF